MKSVELPIPVVIIFISVLTIIIIFFWADKNRISETNTHRDNKYTPDYISRQDNQKKIVPLFADLSQLTSKFIQGKENSRGEKMHEPSGELYEKINIISECWYNIQTNQHLFIKRSLNNKISIYYSLINHLVKKKRFSEIDKDKKLIYLEKDNEILSEMMNCDDLSLVDKKYLNFLTQYDKEVIAQIEAIVEGDESEFSKRAEISTKILTEMATGINNFCRKWESNRDRMAFLFAGYSKLTSKMIQGEESLDGRVHKPSEEFHEKIESISNHWYDQNTNQHVFIKRALEDKVNMHYNMVNCFLETKNFGPVVVKRLLYFLEKGNGVITGTMNYDGLTTIRERYHELLTAYDKTDICQMKAVFEGNKDEFSSMSDAAAKLLITLALEAIR